MATFAEKPVSYTVDTAHAKCPDHLYLIDEGSGTTLNDRGSVGGLNLTLNTDSVWSTTDLTAGGGTSPCIILTNDYARNSGLSFSSSICFVALVKSTSATNPASSENIVSAAKSSNNTDFANLRLNTSGFVTSSYDDSVAAATTKNGATDVYDNTWHLIAAKMYQSGANVVCATSHDGAAWGTATGAGVTGLWSTLNRLCIGSHAGSSLSGYFAGEVAAVLVYKDDSASWDNTWISEVYNSGDPWQFFVLTPSWTVDPSVASQTATVYTIGFTPSIASTIYGVAVVAGSAAPSIAQVKAGQNGSGGAAEAANNKAVTGADTLTLDMGGSPSPTYDLYFVLNTASGDSTLKSIIGAPIGSLGFTVAATVTSQTATVYTLGFTPSASCTIYGVAVVAGAAAPSAAQIKAGQNGSGATAKAANSKAVTGADSLTLTPSDSPAFPRYDLYCILNNGGTDSSIRSLLSEYLDAPANKIFATLSSVHSTSPFYGTGTEANDTCVLASTTTPGSYAVSCAVDGTVLYDSSGDDSRQLLAVDVYDYSAGAYLGAGTLVFNNLAPTPLGEAFSDPLLYQKSVAISTRALDDLAPDPEGDTVTVTALTALPPGFSISANDLTGTPTTYGNTTVSIQWEDQYGATYSEDVEFQIGDLVPYVLNISETTARVAIQAVASFTTEVVVANSQTVAKGDVISTYPEAGALVPYNQLVTMTVSFGSQAPGTGGSGFPVGWQGKRKKLTLKQQPNKHLRKLLDSTGREVLKTKPKKPKFKVKPIKLWS